ncbi:MAG: D-alanyl-D-alanine carboxypeptidase/D-alanyl-D-alanine-endopeptidase, partial [Proteobacteria bacterium]|nr:D-alanyl-D-alanine carboxypeptidase/D-alanyl-D-alanine-endopeptidase [Pseudomonadota bacterium]
MAALLCVAADSQAAISQSAKDWFQEKALAQIAKSPYSQAHWGILVQDLATGEEIFSHGADKLFMPASNRKLFTSAFALDVLGGDFRFRTRVERDGPILAQGVLQGDLIVRASGDPTISSRFRSDSKATGVFRDWARAAKAKGIKRVTGDLIIDTSAFTKETLLGLGWSWNYESDYYAAPVGAFSFNENVVYVMLDPGSSVGMPCKVSIYPKSGHFVIRNQSTTTSKGSNTSVERLRNTNIIVVSGQLSKSSKTDYNTVTVDDPSLFAGLAMRAVFAAEGLPILGKVRTTRTAPKSSGDPGDIISEYISPPLKEILLHVNQSSNNHLAEMIYLAAGRKSTGAPANYEDARKAEQRFWSRNNISDASRIYAADGSGLSRLNLFSPRSFCEILRRMQAHKERENYIGSLAISGYKGTLSGRLSREPYRKRLLGKTGNIANVSCLSGYIMDIEKRTLVFSILV